MRFNKYRFRQITTYFFIGTVTVASTVVYATDNWKWGGVAVMAGFAVSILLVVFASKAGQDD